MDGTSAGGVLQQEDLPNACTYEQWQQFAAVAGERSRGQPVGGTGDGSDATEGDEAALSGSLEENHKCCAPGPGEGKEGESGHLSHCEFQVVARGCKNRHCADCCEHLGVKLRERVRSVVREWKACLLITLTVDPEAVGSPLHAMERVRERRALSRLVRSLLKSGHLKSGRYFAAIEFQKNGHPHWHVLLESSFVPIERVQELWDMNRPDVAGPVRPGRPGFGFVWCSKESFESVEHAANYVTKYVLKYPKEGYPEWVLDFVGRVAKYSTSRGFWGDDESEEAVKLEHIACDCDMCNGREMSGGYWKTVDRKPEEWEQIDQKNMERVVAADQAGEAPPVLPVHHREGILANGLERRQLFFPSVKETRRRTEFSTIRERVAGCCQVGAVVMERTTVVPIEPDQSWDEGGPGRFEVRRKWYWQGMLPISFAEYVEVCGEKRKRYTIGAEEATLLLGGKPWGLAIWKHGRQRQRQEVGPGKSSIESEVQRGD